MQFHYALVDDLLTREEFERRVEEKMEACGDLVDDVTAAMMVVQDLGRHHVKIGRLGGKQSLFSFFGKVITKNPAHEFERPDGEKGLVASLVLGDETGQVRAILWDEKAAAGHDIEIGDVLEVIGKHAGRNRGEITVMAMRPAPVEISGPSEVAPYLSPPRRKDIAVVVIAIGEARKVSRKDGSESEMVEIVVGDGKCITRMVCWAPELMEGIVEGASFRIRVALEKYRRSGPEYSIDEKSIVEPADAEIPAVLDSLGSIAGKETCSVSGTVRSCQPSRSFSTRDGGTSSVRNIVITDGTADARVVLWGDHAKTPLLPGETIALYLCSVRQAKRGESEVHAGRGSLVRVLTPSPVEEEVAGDIVVTGNATYLDTGSDCFLVIGKELPHGHRVKAQVLRTGKRVSILSWDEDVPDRDKLLERCDRFIGLVPGPDTFTPHGREDICR